MRSPGGGGVEWKSPEGTQGVSENDGTRRTTRRSPGGGMSPRGGKESTRKEFRRRRNPGERGES